jgi:hypothetical protein
MSERYWYTRADGSASFSRVCRQDDVASNNIESVVILGRRGIDTLSRRTWPRELVADLLEATWHDRVGGVAGWELAMRYFAQRWVA